MVAAIALTAGFRPLRTWPLLAVSVVAVGLAAPAAAESWPTRLFRRVLYLFYPG